jgi:hypothetical protein
MKPKVIKEGELFALGNRLFTYSLNADGGVIIKPELESYKPVKVKVTFTPPSLDEVKAYFKSKKYLESAAIKFYDYYDSAEWKDGKGNQVKNWKQKAIGVWFKKENEDLGNTSNSTMVR